MRPIGMGSTVVCICVRRATHSSRRAKKAFFSCVGRLANGICDPTLIDTQITVKVVGFAIRMRMDLIRTPQSSYIVTPVRPSIVSAALLQNSLLNHTRHLTISLIGNLYYAVQRIHCPTNEA